MINQDIYPSKQWFWFGLSVAIPVYFGLIALHYVFSQTYVVQDDARIHIVWLQKLIDSQLFPNDLMAQYYSSIQPAGFKWFYQLIAALGIEPMLAAKILPILLALISTVYLFKLTLEILPVPASAFLAALIFNQNIWLKDDLVSATPRAFTYLLLIAFLYYVSKRSPIPCLIVMGLQGLFYPQVLLVEWAVLSLRLWRWRGGLRLTRDPIDYALWLAGLAIVLLTTVWFSRGVAAEFGTLVTADQMKQMPEFGVRGRRQYFGVDWISFWFRGASGVRLPLFPPIIWASVGLPWVLTMRSPLTQALTQNIRLLGQVVLAALGLYGLAHLLFPALYLPSRYTFYSFRVVMAIAAGITLAVLIDRGWRWWQHKRQHQRQRQPPLQMGEWLALGGIGLLAVAVLTVPAIPVLVLPCQSWVIGDTPKIYQFLASQPKETLVASITPDANNIPAFAQRSVLVSPELALPYHSRFYEQMKQRISDLIRLQYSPTLSELRRLIAEYGIDFLMVDRQFADPTYLIQQDWLIYSSVNDLVLKTIAQLQQGRQPALTALIDRCSTLSEKHLILLDASCLQETEPT